MTSLGITRGPAPEIRQDATGLAIDALLAAVSGTSVQTWAAGAVETAAGLWSRSLATATVQGAPVGAPWLAQCGRDLARQGEAAYLVDVGMSGRVRLLRADILDVDGDGPDNSDWWYRLTISGPRRTRTVTAPAAAVVHVRYASEHHSPARGVAPLTYASLTGTLARNLEQALGYETGGAVARIIAVPEGAPNVTTLQTGITAAKGRTLLPETTRGGYGDRAGAPARDWEINRLGADPPMGLVTLRREVENSVLSCFGVPAPLGPAGISDGTAAREGLRRFWSTTIQPLAMMVSAELERVLERPVSITHGHSSSLADVAARARAVHILTQSGLQLKDAMRRVGWE